MHRRPNTAFTVEELRRILVDKNVVDLRSQTVWVQGRSLEGLPGDKRIQAKELQVLDTNRVVQKRIWLNWVTQGLLAGSNEGTD